MLLAPRHLQRLSATIGLFTRFGLADFAKQQGLDAIDHEREQGDAHDPSPEVAEAFRKRLVELGPAYVKLGQVLSTRPDLLPPSYISELEKLQDDVEPIEPIDIETTIESSLGARISKLFSTFDIEPLGTASLGQVHAATMRDGREVVVKVQRPNIRALLKDDLEFFRELAEFMSAHSSAGDRVDLVGIVQQLDQVLTDEIDYCIEARNAMMFRRALAEFPRILIPRVIEAYSTDRVLTTERVRGAKVSAISPLARLDRDLYPVAEELTRAYLKQIVIDGHFHADPHPGNVFIDFGDRENPPTPAEAAAEDRRMFTRPAASPLARLESEAQSNAPSPTDAGAPKLALIDFGMTARLPTTLREQIVQLLLDLADARGDDAAQTLTEMGTTLPTFDRQAYVREVASLMARATNTAAHELDTGRLLYDLIDASFKNGLRLPAELTLLAKTLFNLDSVTRALDPSYTPVPTIRGFTAKIISERARRELNPRHLYQLAMEGTNLLTKLPHRLDTITARLADNEFQTQIDIPQVSLLIEALQKVANRVFSGLVLAGLLVASAMLFPHQRSIGMSGFVLAGVIGLWMVLSILWTDRDGGE